jgi:predicted RNA-binding Zn-ribbon protein involved in translation (DUF1610 family)
MTSPQDFGLDPAEWISIFCPKCGYVITNCSRQGTANLYIDSITHELCGYQGPLEFHNPELAGFKGGVWIETDYTAGTSRILD